jgi:hypothetical protein
LADREHSAGTLNGDLSLPAFAPCLLSLLLSPSAASAASQYQRQGQ